MLNRLNAFGLTRLPVRKPREEPPERRLLKTCNFFALLVLSSRRFGGSSLGFCAGSL